jgi:hypothetical protein
MKELFARYDYKICPEGDGIGRTLKEWREVPTFRL